MKNRAIIITILSIALFAAGSAMGQTVSQDAGSVKKEAKTDAEDVKDYTYAEKAKFTEQMKRLLARINRDIDQIDAKIAKADADAKAKAKPKLHALRLKADQLGKQIEAAGNAIESNWDRAKADAKSAYSELKDGVNRTRQWMSDKIAP